MKIIDKFFGLFLFLNVISVGYVAIKANSEPIIFLNILGVICFGYWLGVRKK
jgi:hypothetical protein